MVNGSCQDGSDCMSTCDYTDVGKKWKIRQKFFWSKPNSIKSRFTASPDGSINDDKKDYRFIIKLSRRFCGDHLIDSIDKNINNLSVTDFSNVYNIEHNYKDFDSCKQWVELYKLTTVRLTTLTVALSFTATWFIYSSSSYSINWKRLGFWMGR